MMSPPRNPPPTSRDQPLPDLLDASAQKDPSAEELAKARVRDAMSRKLPVLLRILTSAYEQLDSIGPNLEELMSVEVANGIATARGELWSAMERVRKDIEVLP